MASWPIHIFYPAPIAGVDAKQSSSLALRWNFFQLGYHSGTPYTYPFDLRQRFFERPSFTLESILASDNTIPRQGDTITIGLLDAIYQITCSFLIVKDPSV